VAGAGSTGRVGVVGVVGVVVVVWVVVAVIGPRALGVAPGVVYTTFHHPDTQANVITTEYSDWATNCPEYKVTAVQISPSNGPSEWQKAYDEQARHSRRIAPVVEAAE